MVIVRFMPRGVEFQVPAGTRVLDAARAVDLPMASSCEARLACGWCLVRVLEGAENLSPVDAEEAQVLKRKNARPDERLACSTFIQGPVTLTTSYW